ncbi:MAG: hypothetical protein JJ992_04460 [Planctomycetes bacterium]|nr:hypothetical protein [Planctomycetota bacterium]
MSRTRQAGFSDRTPMRPAAVWLVWWIGVAILGGCDSRPRAPVLRTSPVYRNPDEGFRFLVPDGWIQQANSVLPRGKLEGETFLVRYRLRSPEPGATLQIVCFDPSLTDDLAKHHAGPSYRVERWKPAEESAEETIQINGVPAERFVYTAMTSGRSMTKEVVCFRKNERMYCFVGLFWSSDDKAREQIRRAVDSTIWES